MAVLGKEYKKKNRCIYFGKDTAEYVYIDNIVIVQRPESVSGFYEAKTDCHNTIKDRPMGGLLVRVTGLEPTRLYGH